MRDFEPRPDRAYAMSAIVIAVLLLLAMLATLLAVLFVVHGIASTL
ncbi:MAG: hypothetical protein ACRDN0_18330 [Trebonia sp.]